RHKSLNQCEVRRACSKNCGFCLNNFPFHPIISASNTSAKYFFTFSFTSFIGTFWPNSLSSEVTALSLIPQGMMYSKYFKSGLTFSAKPCIVTQREALTPIAQIFLAKGFPTSNQTPVSPFERSPFSP